MSYLLPRFLTIFFSLLLIDYIAFRALRVVMQEATRFKKNFWYSVYWIVSAFSLVSIALYFSGILRDMSPFRLFVQGFVSVIYFSKIAVVFFVLFEDILFYTKKIIHFLKQKFSTQNPTQETDNPNSKKITRSQFIHKTALVAGALPFATLSWGIISGAHDYQVRRRKIYLPHLPKEFEGFSIAQISDIHSGSFYNKTAVMGGVEMLLAEKPNLIFSQATW